MLIAGQRAQQGSLIAASTFPWGADVCQFSVDANENVSTHLIMEA